MFGFGKRQADGDVRVELARLGQRVTSLESTLRQLEGEQILMHDQVRKWMRRAVAAERAMVRNQEPSVQTIPVTPERPPTWGARRRILERRLARAAREPVNGAGAELGEQGGDGGTDS